MTLPFYIISLKQSENEIIARKALEIQVKNKILVLNGEVMEIAILNLLDKFYPVGSYYETSDDDFDPNTAWGGTWERMNDGTVLISQGWYHNTTDPEAGRISYVGETVGERWHSLTIDQIPEHTHRIYGSTSKDGAHIHGIATANGLGDVEWGYNFTYDNYSAGYNTGAFPSGGNGSHSHTMDFESEKAGGTWAVDMTQLSLVVCRWHRTA